MDSSRRRRRPFSLEFQQAPPGPGLVHAESLDTRRTDPIGAGIDGSSKKFRRYTIATAIPYLISVILAPLILAFWSPRSGQPIFVVEWVLDVYCIADWFIFTFVRLVNEPSDGPQHLSWSKRFWKLRYQRIVEFVGLVLPLVSWSAQGPFGVAWVLGLARLLRFARVWHVMREIELVHWASVIMNYLLAVGLAGHIEGCLLYYLARSKNFDGHTWVGFRTCELPLGCLNEQPRTVWKSNFGRPTPSTRCYFRSCACSMAWSFQAIDAMLSPPRSAQYLRSLYFALVTVSTVGYGDLSPISSAEILFCTIMMVLNLSLTCYTVAAVSALFRRQEEAAEFRDELVGLSSYLKHNGIHRKEREALVEYRRATYNRLKGADLLDGLPTAIKAAVYEKRYRAMLDKTNIFRGVPHRVVQAVLSASREEHFLADMRLWHAGDIPTVAYLLQTGEVDVVLAGDGEDDDGAESYDRDNPVCTMTMGAMLGGAAVFGGAALHGWSLIARTNTTVVVVDPDALRDPAALGAVVENLRRSFSVLAARARGDVNDASSGRRPNLTSGALTRFANAPSTARGAVHFRLGDGNGAEAETKAPQTPRTSSQVWDDESMTYKTVSSPSTHLAEESKIPDNDDYRLIAENDDDGDYWRVRQWARPGARSEAWARKLDDAAAALARTSARTSAALAEALCDAAARGDAWRLDALLARGGGAALQKECRNYEGRTPAHLAASHGRVDVLELLHRRGLSLSATDAFGGTPLLSAATRAPRATAAATIAFLRDRAGSLAVDNLGEMLSQKASDNETDALARLLAAGADPNARDSHGKAALHAAAVAGHPTTLLALLDAGADVDARDLRDRTPLAHATYRRRLDCLRILLSRGADPNALDEDGASVVDIALKAGSDDCASELIKAGGAASSADDGGATRLRAAACSGDVCLLERLVKAGLSPDAATADDGRTALHLAAGEGKLRVASKLVELGADVHFTDRQGRNALDIARTAGYYDLEARLRLLAET